MKVSSYTDSGMMHKYVPLQTLTFKLLQVIFCLLKDKQQFHSREMIHKGHKGEWSSSHGCHTMFPLISLWELDREENISFPTTHREMIVPLSEIYIHNFH